MKRFLSLVLAALLLLSISCTAAFADESEQPIIQNLKTNGRVNPIGIDTPQPEFSWQMFSSAVGAGQKAYHIVVTDEQGNTVWDTGVVESPVSVGILYEGEALQPTTEYRWTLTVTDRDGRELTAGPASFETSLMDATFEAWDGAEWIGSPDLPLDAPSKAVFHISADVTLAEGSSTASFILGAGDFRLENRAFNPWLAEGENYVANELIITRAEHTDITEPLPFEQTQIIETDALDSGDETVIKGTVEYGTDIEQLCEELEQREDIVRADPNYIQKIDEIEIPDEARRTGSDFNAFNWYRDSLHLTDAWRTADTLGSEEIVVAVIDTGINTEHKDLQGAMWTDAEGHYGYNATAQNYDVSDTYGHGSNVAGIIAMRANDYGYVGIAPQVKLMACKAANNQFLSDADILACLNYAVDNGADIINMSFGSKTLSATMATAYQRASAKTVLIAAAGNDGNDAAVQPQYPAACGGVTGVMSYGSTKKSDLTNYTIDNGTLSDFSNYGDIVLWIFRSLYLGILPGFGLFLIVRGVIHFFKREKIQEENEENE